MFENGFGTSVIALVAGFQSSPKLAAEVKSPAQKSACPVCIRFRFTATVGSRHEGRVPLADERRIVRIDDVYSESAWRRIGADDFRMIRAREIAIERMRAGSDAESTEVVPSVRWSSRLPAPSRGCARDLPGERSPLEEKCDGHRAAVEDRVVGRRSERQHRRRRRDRHRESDRGRVGSGDLRVIRASGITR